MFFKDARHREAYRELAAKVGAEGGREARAAVYVLAAVEKDLGGYVSPARIDFSSLLEVSGSWSSGERALVKLAATLFNAAAWPVVVDEVFSALDAENFRLAVEALTLRYGWGLV